MIPARSLSLFLLFTSPFPAPMRSKSELQPPLSVVTLSETYLRLSETYKFAGSFCPRSNSSLYNNLRLLALSSFFPSINLTYLKPPDDIRKIFSMPPPPSKKQKRETNNSASSSSSAMRAQEVKSLIITPGGSPADTKIRVSLTDFYISSVLLKSHSPWFYDLYDKVVNDDSKIIVVDDDDTLPRYRFRAEWKDESWTLVRRQV
jgi:hypothetical protein